LNFFNLFVKLRMDRPEYFTPIIMLTLPMVKGPVGRCILLPGGLPTPVISKMGDESLRSFLTPMHDSESLKAVASGSDVADVVRKNALATDKKSVKSEKAASTKAKATPKKGATAKGPRGQPGSADRQSEHAKMRFRRSRQLKRLPTTPRRSTFWGTGF
jgi:hypothetical protein